MPRQTLRRLGVLHWSVPVATHADGLARIAAERGYKNRDEVKIRADAFPAARLEQFYDEHLHEDEEIRYIVDGAGYFDVRDQDDQWIRIHTRPGDLIVLPAGIYHRFTLDAGGFVHAIRLFQDEPKWTPLNRPADDAPSRRAYVHGLAASMPIASS